VDLEAVKVRADDPVCTFLDVHGLAGDLRAEMVVEHRDELAGVRSAVRAVTRPGVVGGAEGDPLPVAERSSAG
jgi:hypothetical protein